MEPVPYFKMSNSFFPAFDDFDEPRFSDTVRLSIIILLAFFQGPYKEIKLESKGPVNSRLVRRSHEKTFL